MLDTKARHLIDGPADWLARLAHKARLMPDHLTLLSFAVGVTAGGCMATGRESIGLAMLWFSGFLDVADGQLARLTCSASRSGALLDMILDRMVEAAFVAGMVIADPRLALPVIGFLIMVIFNFSTFLAAGSLISNTGIKAMHYDDGLIERTETFLFLTAAVVLWPWRGTVLWTLDGLILITGVIRFTKVYRLLKMIEEERT